jgi:hypothetical protein
MSDAKNADGMSRAVEETCGPKGLVPWYLMAGLTYYHFDESILTDGRFDEIGKTLLAAWDDIEHNHKHFITRADLEAGTLLLKIEEYPMMTRSAANAVLGSTGRKLNDEQYRRLYDAPFIPPERLRDDVELYTYFTQGEIKRSWKQARADADKEIKERLDARAKEEQAPTAQPVVRTRQRPSPAPEIPVAEAPVVRTRVRPAPVVVAEPEVRVRTRVRPA